MFGRQEYPSNRSIERAPSMEEDHENARDCSELFIIVHWLRVVQSKLCDVLFNALVDVNKDSVTSVTVESDIISIPYRSKCSTGPIWVVVVYDALWVSAAVISRVRVCDAKACQHGSRSTHEDLSYWDTSRESGAFWQIFQFVCRIHAPCLSTLRRSTLNSW